MNALGKRLLLLGGVALGASALTFLAVRARAAGVPEANALTYTGYLEEAEGVALTGTHAITVQFWESEEAVDALCAGNVPDSDLRSGRFQVALPASCADAVKARPDVWVDVSVDGASLGRTKLGAVPYALEAGHATSADHAVSADDATHAATADSAKSANSAKSADTAKAVTAGLLTHNHSLAVSDNGTPGTVVANGATGTDCTAGCAAGTVLTGGGCQTTGCGAGFNYACPGMNLQESFPDSGKWCCIYNNASGTGRAIHAHQVCSAVSSKTLP